LGAAILFLLGCKDVDGKKMLTIPHTIAGAAIGLLVTNLPHADLVAFSAGWASHYVLDSIPHWERLYDKDAIDFETDLRPELWPRSVYYQAIADVLIAVAIVFWLVRFHGQPYLTSPILWGAIGGFWPDFLDNMPYWNRFTEHWPIFKQIKQFHSWIHVTTAEQKRAGRYTGLISQIIIIGLGLWVLL
jgi:hypothetical protein